MLYALFDAAATALGAEAARTLKALAETLQAVRREVGRVATSAAWARAFAQLLQRCGWPGPGLHSGEQQIRMRFDELLGEFAALECRARCRSGRRLSCCTSSQRAASSSPRATTWRSPSPRASHDPIVRYDGIWVAGLTAAVLPAAARTDALLPVALQRQARMPGADPSAEPRRALRLLGSGTRRAGSAF